MRCFILACALARRRFAPTLIHFGSRTKDIDKDANGEIDFDEFLDLMTSRLAGSDTKEDIRKIFELFDDDKTGYISLSNLKRVAAELGETMDDAELLEMIERADTDRDGLISLEEFYTIMTQKTFG